MVIRCILIFIKNELLYSIIVDIDTLGCNKETYLWQQVFPLEWLIGPQPPLLHSPKKTKNSNNNLKGQELTTLWWYLEARLPEGEILAVTWNHFCWNHINFLHVEFASLSFCPQNRKKVSLQVANLSYYINENKYRLKQFMNSVIDEVAHCWKHLIFLFHGLFLKL